VLRSAFDNGLKSEEIMSNIKLSGVTVHTTTNAPGKLDCREIF
jgi:hypothetical protein